MSTAGIILAAVVVAVAAAIRSTWSPCGLSMLSTITPLAERAKGNSYRATVAWFIAGSVVGGATLGAAMAVLAAGIAALGPSPTAAGLLAVAACVIALGSDSGVGGIRLPVHRRQVNERWLDQYRGWVYGAGFGWQIGTGVCTYITSAAVYLVVVLAALGGRPTAAWAIGAGFGLLRGLAVLLTRRVQDPAALRAFHRRFVAVGPRAGRTVVAAEVVATLVIAAATRSPVVLVVMGGTGVVILVARRASGTTGAPVCDIPTRSAVAPGPVVPGASRAEPSVRDGR